MRSCRFPLGVLFLILLLPAVVGAQPLGPPPLPDSARIEQTMSDLKAKVKITDAQATTIRAILKDNSAAMQRDREKGTLDRQAARERMRAMDDTIKAVLTPEQLPLYDTYREERRQMMRNRMREMPEKPQ
jgi:hypothetical protein